MEKRVFVAVLISIGVLALWAIVAPKLFPDLAKKPAVTSTSPKTQTAKPAAATTAGTTAPAAAPAPATPAAPPAPVQPISAQSITVSQIETPDYIARFSNRGAELVSFRLKHYKAKDGSLVELVKGREASRTDFPFAVESSDPAVSVRLNTALYAVTDTIHNGAGTLEYRYAGGGVAATKIYRFTGDYLFHFAVNVTPAVPYRVVTGPGIRTLDPDEAESRFTISGNGVAQIDDSLKVISREKAPKFSVFDSPQFVGLADNYFLSVFRPEQSAGGILRAVDFGTGKQKRRELYAGLNAIPDGTVSGTAFFGPKETALVDRYGLERTMQLGMFGIIARFFLILLNWINRFTHNYGFAIIILTILIKVALYPLQHKWMMSMKKMQKAQPKMESIKAKYRKHKGTPTSARR